MLKILLKLNFKKVIVKMCDELVKMIMVIHLISKNVLVLAIKVSR